MTLLVELNAIELCYRDGGIRPTCICARWGPVSAARLLMCPDVHCQLSRSSMDDREEEGRGRGQGRGGESR